MIDLETFVYFLFMEEQEQNIENRSIEQDSISSEDSPPKDIGQAKKSFLPVL